jgi:signal transduction histidine kinase
MENPERPVLRSRVWPVAGLLLAVLLLPVMAMSIERPEVAIAAALVVVVLAVTVVVWALVRTRGQRRSYEERLTAWAAESAAQAERLRIARELHDLASHGLGLITVRAAAARIVAGADSSSEQSRALADIERAGRDATTELRRMLTVLRSPGDEAPLRPADTLDDLPGIVEAAERGGVRAALRSTDAGTPSAGVQMAVCAIVREALANTARHAGPVRAEVTVRREGDVVVAEVVDEGPAAGWRPHPGAGAGLAGLGERVAALGGTLHAAGDAHGYRVSARMPDGSGR